MIRRPASPRVFALRGNTLMEGMYQFEVVITVPTIRENGTLDTNKQVQRDCFHPADLQHGLLIE